MRLHQVTAKLDTLKGPVAKELTAVYQGKGLTAEQLGGIEKTYQPRDEDGEQLPGEGKVVEVVVGDVLARLRTRLGKLFQLQAMQDFGNQSARADVAVDGRTILTDVPVTYLLWLAKQLTDLRTMLTNLPVLDPKLTWIWDPHRHAYVAAPVHTARSKKVPRNHVKAPATDKHPAQVEVYYEDVVVGDWTTVRLSGAVPMADVRLWRDRVDELIAAVKVAREQANLAEVPDDTAESFGQAVFGYVFDQPPVQ